MTSQLPVLRFVMMVASIIIWDSFKDLLQSPTTLMNKTIVNDLVNKLIQFLHRNCRVEILDMGRTVVMVCSSDRHNPRVSGACMCSCIDTTNLHISESQNLRFYCEILQAEVWRYYAAIWIRHLGFSANHTGIRKERLSLRKHVFLEVNNNNLRPFRPPWRCWEQVSLPRAWVFPVQLACLNFCKTSKFLGRVVGNPMCSLR